MITNYVCDVLVIGAGPAGATAAIELAKSDFTVMLVDKKRVIGEPVACAGFIPAWITQHIKLTKNCITNRIDFMRTFLPDGTIDDTKTPGYIVDRALFDKNLVRQALENGVKLYAGMNVTEITPEAVQVKYKNDDQQIKTKIIIGTDGPKSITGKYIGSEVSEFIIGKQYEMALTEPMNHSEVYFHDDYTGGYGWLFPKGKFANIGVGMLSSDALKLPERLDRFVDTLIDQRRIHPNSNVRTAEGLVPISGPVDTTVKDNVILAGDAAGLTHPITGAGILNAVISGKEAGLAAVEALTKLTEGDVDLQELKRYEKEWKMFLKSDLELAKKRRELLNGYYRKEHEKFKNLVEAEKKCWVVFKGYYHDKE